jgi:hypothetical protein
LWCFYRPACGRTKDFAQNEADAYLLHICSNYLYGVVFQRVAGVVFQRIRDAAGVVFQRAVSPAESCRVWCFSGSKMPGVAFQRGKTPRSTGVIHKRVEIDQRGAAGAIDG